MAELRRIVKTGGSWPAPRLPAAGMNREVNTLGSKSVSIDVVDCNGTESADRTDSREQIPEYCVVFHTSRKSPVHLKVPVRAFPFMSFHVDCQESA